MLAYHGKIRDVSKYTSLLFYFKFIRRKRPVPLLGGLLCIAEAMHAAEPGSHSLHFGADVFGKYCSLTTSILSRANRLMELTAQSIVSQEGGRGLEEGSRIAEARLLVPLHFCDLVSSAFILLWF